MDISNRVQVCWRFSLILAMPLGLGAQTSSSVSLAANPTPSVFGAPVTLTASVTPSAATGKVTFYADSVVLGVSAVSAGSATMMTELLASGAHTLRARYSGDSTYAASVSATVSQTVTPNPAGGFHSASDLPGPDTPLSIALADLRGDGKVDALIGTDSGLSICLGDGSGALNCTDAYQGGPGFEIVATGDFNGDGKPDVALAIQDQSLQILLGNGDGTVQPPTARYPVGQLPVAMAVSDFDGDGNADIVVVNQTDNDVAVYLGRGDGTFANGVTYPVGSVPTSVAIADFNGDGIPDLAVGIFVSNSVSVLLGNADGTFQAAIDYPLAFLSLSIAAADFNGDGKIDLACVCAGGPTVTLGNGDGTFQPPISSTGNFNQPSTAGDFNGDGKLDLAVPDGTGNVAILLGNGDGSFQSPLQYRIPGGATSPVAVADFNADGRSDLAIATNDGLSVLLGQADANPVVNAVSVSPASGAGGYQIFSFVFSDSAGAADLASVSASVSAGDPGCIVTFRSAQNTLTLSTNSANVSGTIPMGSGNLQNSACDVVGSQTSVAASGGDLTLNVAIGLRPSAASFDTVSGEALSSTGSSSGWQTLGYWNYNTPNSPPQVVSVQPAGGTGWGRTFSFVYQDSDGATSLSSVQAMVNSSQSTASSCYLSIDPVNGLVSLADDSGTVWLGPVAFGAQGTLRNSQCSVNPTASSGAIANNLYTANLALTFMSGFAGAKSIYGDATDVVNRISGWQAIGTWTVGAPLPCDVDGDGEFDVADIQDIVNQTLGLSAPAADVNGDGVVDVLDAQMVVNAILFQSCSSSM